MAMTKNGMEILAENFLAIAAGNKKIFTRRRI